VELNQLGPGEDLAGFLRAVRPSLFGVHWPLCPGDPRDLRLLGSDRAGFEEALARLGRRMAGTGAAYVLVHFPERGEPWPGQAEVGERVWALGALARELGMDVVLEPKEPVAEPGGLAAFASSGLRLPPGVAFCLDTNDWRNACRHLPPATAPAVPATHFHLHAMHLRPDGSGLYLHAPPWVDPGPDPGWPELLQPDPAELARLAGPASPVAVNVEVDPRYATRMLACLEAVRGRLAAAGWLEEP